MKQKSSQNSKNYKAGPLVHHYILDEHNRVVSATLEECMAWFSESTRKEDEVLKATDDWDKVVEVSDRFLFRTRLGDVIVSTVFMGINLNITDRPMVFESQAYTDVEGKEREWEIDIAEYATYEEAARGHRLMIKRILDRRFELLILKGLYIPKESEVSYD